LLPKFISKKGRPFSAYLVLGKDGKVSFEFEARQPRAAGGKKTAKAKTEGGKDTPEPAGAATT
jgi:DNA topoisomerase-3